LFSHFLLIRFSLFITVLKPIIHKEVKRRCAFRGWD
jgi:hypothetical protein